MHVCSLQVAPIGIADRVLLGLIPSSENSWPVACSCLRPDTGGWLHVHGNVSSKPMSLHPSGRFDQTNVQAQGSKMFRMSEHATSVEVKQEVGDEDGSCLHLRPSCTSRSNRVGCNSAWVRWGNYVQQHMSALLTENNPIPGFAWLATVRHIEHVKSYAPYVDHLVVDLECRLQSATSD